MNNLLNAALVAIIVVGGLVLFTPADEPQPFASIETPAISVDLGYVVPGHHVLSFPDVEPDNKWAIIVLTNDDWRGSPQERDAVEWFAGGESERIVWSGSEAKFWHFPASNKHHNKYAAVYGTNYPIIAVQRFDGGTAYKVSEGNLPKDARALHRKIASWLAKVRPVKLLVKHRKKVNAKRQDCPDGQCTPNRGRRPFGFLRPFHRPDDSDGNEPPPVEPPPVEPLVHPDYKAPIPDSDPVASLDEPTQDNSTFALLAGIAGAAVGSFTKFGV